MSELTHATKRKGAAPDQESAPSQKQHPHDNKSRKWVTTLSHLLKGARDRFEAEHWGDHALHSTVSGLQRNYGLQFSREWREVPTRFGKPCRVKAYWVAELSREHAMRLVARHRRKKGEDKQ